MNHRAEQTSSISRYPSEQNGSECGDQPKQDKETKRGCSPSIVIADEEDHQRIELNSMPFLSTIS
uniref:Uncharacterized protein n=1 Tax=Rhizophora mucronata TaxID=61149 RepID=A0A2P2JXX8_RHIMU